MNILHINTLDRGGAANACFSINKALNDLGVNSHVMVLNQTKKRENVSVYNYWENVDSKYKSFKKMFKQVVYDRQLRHLHEALPPYPGVFSFPETIYDITETTLYQEADIIQLNWTHAFLDEPSFFSKNKKPVVWRMADLYITGGGPHYELGFPYSTFTDIISKNLEIRKQALSSPNLNLTIVPISNWCYEKAEQSDLTKEFNKRIITCGIDPSTFNILDKEICRRVLNLPLHKKLILVGADSLNDERKGFKFLVEALKNLDTKNIAIVTFGSGKLDNLPTINLDFINDTRLLHQLYYACDLFITPALEEAFGQTSIEAMACGLPLVSFQTGGALEIFKTKKTIGVLAKDFTSEALSEAIQHALNTNYDSNEIIEYTFSNFNIEKKASEYIDLYKQIIKSK